MLTEELYNFLKKGGLNDITNGSQMIKIDFIDIFKFKKQRNLSMKLHIIMMVMNISLM